MVFEVVIGRDKKDLEKYGLKGTVQIAKQYIKMGQTTSLSNPVYLDVAGSHVVFIVGKRGSGKCLHGDTLITLNDGSQAKIKDLENNDNDIFTLDENLKIKTGQKSNFFKRPTNKLIEIGLRSGRTIKLTPEHPLLTVKGWLPAEKLGFGSRIATPRKVEAFGESSMPEHEIKLLAYLIAEGHLGNRFVLFSNMDEKILQEFKQSVTNLDSNLRVDLHSKRGCYRVSQVKKVMAEQSKRGALGRFNVGPKFSHSSIRNWVGQFGLYNKNSYTKFIPKEVFRLPKHQLSLFLNRLFSCDGTIYKKSDHWFVSYCSSSKEIIDTVQHLLLRFGVLSKIRNKNIKQNGKLFYSHELEVYGENVNQYLQEIGFYGKKEEKAKIALIESIKIIRNPNIDTIPKEIWDMYQPNNWAEIGRKVGYAHPKALRESIHYSPSRQKLLQIALADESELLSKFAASDIFWDEITSMRLLEGEFEVYDLTVPETHNFVANDIIVHNSYTLGAIAEGLSDLPQEIKQNLSILLIDTMGIYWTMKYPNFQDTELAKQWNLTPKGLDVKIYTPSGFYNQFKEEGLPTDFPFSIRPIDVNPEDWCTAFGISPNSAEGVLITKIVQNFNNRGESYSLDELIDSVRGDPESDRIVKSVVVNQFEKANGWGIFSTEGTPLKELVAAGQVTVLDISPYATIASGWEIKALVTGLICRSLFNQRMLARKNEEFKSVDSAMHYFAKETEEKLEQPLTWLAIDECLPYSSSIRTNHGEMKIGQIINQWTPTTQLQVWGYDISEKNFGFFPTTRVYQKGIREIIEITTETSRKIKCTPDHKVLTKSGFKEAQKAKNIGTPLLLDYSRERKHIIARLVGHLYGDGWLSGEKGSRGRQAGFSGKKDWKDLDKIRNDLNLIGFSSGKIYSRETVSKIKHHTGKEVIVNGTTHSVQASVNVYNFFSKLGVPVGKKTNNEVLIPGWLMKASKQEKAEFLAALFGADGMAPSQSNKWGGDFNPIRLTFNKKETLRENGEKYAEQIKTLFNDLGIGVSQIKERKDEGNIRKDGTRSIKFVITLAKNVENTITFLEKVGYRYCTEKEIKGNKWLNYLKARRHLLKERIALREKALKIKKETGWGKRKIARELGIPAYQVWTWVDKGHKANLPWSFPNFDQWIQSRCKNDSILYEKIISKVNKKPEQVYDLSVDKVHNFVADGFIVHNCHELLPREGKTAATDALITILREGRQPGISLILASQQPAKIHTDVMTQADTVIAHRLTSQMDIEALGQLMQSYMRKGLDQELAILPPVKGAALIFDDANERMFPVQMRPRFTWHGGSSPIAIQEKKDYFKSGLKKLREI